MRSRRYYRYVGENSSELYRERMDKLLGELREFRESSGYTKIKSYSQSAETELSDSFLFPYLSRVENNKNIVKVYIKDNGF